MKKWHQIRNISKEKLQKESNGNSGVEQYSNQTEKNTLERHSSRFELLEDRISKSEDKLIEIMPSEE